MIHDGGRLVRWAQSEGQEGFFAMTIEATTRFGERSPGKVFADACHTGGTSTSVEFDYTISDALLGSRAKPRVPVRTLFKTVDVSRHPPTHYWHESQLETAAGPRPEAARRFHASPVPALLPTTAWVQVPPALLDDPDTLATFINYRLIVRLCTAENEALVVGPGGLLHQPGVTMIRPGGGLRLGLLAACAEVEHMGGTADGVVLHPADYWRFVGSGQFVADLEAQGIRVVRTRLMPSGHALVGDFGHGAVLLDGGRSTIRFAEPPPGVFAEEGLAVTAEIWERLVLNLPMNFFRVAGEP